MTVVTIVFLIVCALWFAVAICIVLMIIDITNMRRERQDLEAKIKAAPPPLRIGTWFDNISINQRGHTGMRWRATSEDEIGQMMTIREIPPPRLSPETERALQLMGRLRDEQYLRIERAFLHSSQAYSAARRCDICGASTPEQKTERCRNACGQIHGCKTTVVPWFDAAAWTGRRPGWRGVRGS